MFYFVLVAGELVAMHYLLWYWMGKKANSGGVSDRDLFHLDDVHVVTNPVVGRANIIQQLELKPKPEPSKVKAQLMEELSTWKHQMKAGNMSREQYDAVRRRSLEQAPLRKPSKMKQELVSSMVGKFIDNDPHDKEVTQQKHNKTQQSSRRRRQMRQTKGDIVNI